MVQIAEKKPLTVGVEEAVGRGVAPPPMVFGAGLLLGLLLHLRWPLSFFPRRPARPIGSVLALSGLALLTASVEAMRRAGTTPDPDEPTRVLVETGPYRFSRNPIYLGMALTYAGVATFANALWPLLLLPALLRSVGEMVEREEHYLTRRFGGEYRVYRARVRRWL